MSFITLTTVARDGIPFKGDLTTDCQKEKNTYFSSCGISEETKIFNKCDIKCVSPIKVVDLDGKFADIEGSCIEVCGCNWPFPVEYLVKEDPATVTA